MILYDGIDLQSVADVKIEDIRVSSIQYAPVARNRAVSAGSVFVRNRSATRTVTVTFALLKSERDARQAALKAINAWAKTDKEYRIDIAGHQNQYLTGVCTAKPDPSLRQWWESKLRVVFTCFNDPFWNDDTVKTVACGTAFTVLGDAEPIMQIVKTRDSDASNVAYSDGTNTINLSTVPAGDMVIDLNRETIRVGTTSIMQYYGNTSRWIHPKIGTQTITGDGAVQYRERWE